MLGQSPPFSIVCIWLCLLSNQIPRFFNHQYLWKESMLSQFFAWSQSGREGINCNHFRLGVASFINQIAGFFLSQYLLKESIICQLRFWLGVTRCVSCPDQIAGIFDSQYHWKESMVLSHQENEATDTTFGWVQPVVSLILTSQIAGFFNHE